MNVQFYAGSKRPQRAVSFLPCKQPTVVRLLCKPADWVRVWLHWSDGRSVPCLGRDCKHCSSEPRLYAYGACIVGQWRFDSFRNGAPAIICVTDSAWSVTEDDYRHVAVEFRRQGSAQNAELSYRVLGNALEPIEPPFPIRQRLMSIWQVRNNQDEAKMKAVTGFVDDFKAGFGNSTSRQEGELCE